MGRIKWAVDEDNILVDNYPTIGLSGCMMLLPKRTKSAIENRAITHLKLKLDSNVKSKILIEANTKNRNVGATQFIEDFTRESVYVLGFLWADGYITKTKSNKSINTKITAIDGYDLLPVFQKTGKWNVYVYNTKYKPSMTITTSNSRLYDFLFENDYKNKSIASADSILSHIPLELKPYFFRGVVDGDGCFYWYCKKNDTPQRQFAVTSSWNQDWSYLQTLCEELSITYHIKKVTRKKSKYSVFQILNRSGIITIGDYIYTNKSIDNIGLKRKFDKFLKIKTQ